ncbi:Uncharacterised protein [Vibrio cholerae]|nr:Uncharacterised protein [Vibrio cholerae]
MLPIKKHQPKLVFSYSSVTEITQQQLVLLQLRTLQSEVER